MITFAATQRWWSGDHLMGMNVVLMMGKAVEMVEGSESRDRTVIGWMWGKEER